MKRISLSRYVEELSKQRLGHDPIDLFERVRDGRKIKKFDLIDVALALNDIECEVRHFEETTKKKICELEAEVKKLRGILNKGPTNSHKPPSSEKNQKIKSSREKSNNPPGGQNGHTGSAHELHDDPDVVHRYDVQKCMECGASLKNTAEHEVIRKQTIDIRQGKMHITEYQTVIKFCPECGRWNRGEEPESIQKSRVIFGTNVKSVAVYLNVQQLLPFNRVQEVLLDLFGVSVSQGSLCNFVRELGHKLSDWESEVKLQLLNSPVIHVDETGVRCASKSSWAHVICNESLTLIFHHSKRGREAIEDIGVLPEYKGHLVHDAFASYRAYGATHSLCNAHILRELKYLSEEEGQKWSVKMSDFLKATLHKTHQGRTRSRYWLRKVQQEYLQILKQGFKECGYAREWKGRPPDGYKNDWEQGKRVKVPIFRRRKLSKRMNLLNRLRDFRQEVLAFVFRPEVPFTNNQAERDFRMTKLKEKISGCFRSPQMATLFLRVRSFLCTLRKQLLPPLENLALIDICCE